MIPVYVSPGHFKHFGFDHSPLHRLVKQDTLAKRTNTLFFAGTSNGLVMRRSAPLLLPLPLPLLRTKTKNIDGPLTATF